MAPEAHGAEVLLDPDYMPNMCFTPTKTLVCYIFGFIKFSPKHTVEAAEPMIDHGSRSTRSPGPSRSRLQTQEHLLPPPKQDWPTTFVL